MSTLTAGLNVAAANLLVGHVGGLLRALIADSSAVAPYTGLHVRPENVARLVELHNAAVPESERIAWPS